MYEHVFTLEQELLTNSTRKNPDRLEQLLALDFFEFCSSGNVWSRKEILERLPTEVSTQVTASDFQVHELSVNAVLVTYRTARVEPDGSLFKALRSSIWKSNGSVWQMLFHQGTKLSDEQ
jgi:hypothetical protein